MRNRWAVSTLGLLLGVALGVALSYVPGADAARNSSGTYSLPAAYNPVQTGTIVQSTWANNTMSDISTEITNSLDRNGRGAMLAALQCYAGTVSAPGLTFSSDTDTGLYRVGANNPAMAAGGVQAQSWSTTGTTVPGILTVTDGGVVTTQGTNTTALTVTGNGSGNGITASGGATGKGIDAYGGGSSVGVSGTSTGTGVGVYGAGGTNGAGVQGAGNGTGSGGVFTGGSGGNGVVGTAGGSATGGIFTGGGSGGVGVNGTGTGTSPGGYFAGGTAATGGTRQDAVTITNGDINFSSVAEVTSTTSVSERLTVSNLPKLWAKIDTNGSGTATVAAGFNVASAAISSGDLVVGVGADFANADQYACVVTGGVAGYTYRVHSQIAGEFVVERSDDNGPAAEDSFATSPADEVNVVCFGAQ